MKFLAVIKPPYICHVRYTQKTLWEEKFTPVNIISSGHSNVRKHKKIDKGEQYIALEIYFGLFCLYKRKVTYSGPRDYVVTSGKG